MKRKVTYLFGAGSSHAEATLYDRGHSLLMADVADGILKRIASEEDDELSELKNDLAKEGTDVEQLISVYDSSGTSRDRKIANRLREFFIDECRERFEKLPKDFVPTITSALIDYHTIESVDEELAGIMTLNYDDFIERSYQQVHGGVNMVIHGKVDGGAFCIDNTQKPIVKLHGSFDWINDFPIRFGQTNSISYEDLLWLPPGVNKKKESYPFSILWGRARELLDCDIVRVVGCSLSRNDWDMVSLLQVIQRVRSRSETLVIELIDFQNFAARQKKSYPYLIFRSICEIEAVRNYMLKEYFPRHDSARPLESYMLELLSIQNDPSKTQNIYEFWMRSLIHDLKSRDIPLSTEKGLLEGFNQRHP